MKSIFFILINLILLQFAHSSEPCPMDLNRICIGDKVGAFGRYCSSQFGTVTAKFEGDLFEVTLDNSLTDSTNTASAKTIWHMSVLMKQDLSNSSIKGLKYSHKYSDLTGFIKEVFYYKHPGVFPFIAPASDKTILHITQDKYPGEIACLELNSVLVQTEPK